MESGQKDTAGGVIVAGGGRVGRMAVARLQERVKAVIDLDPEPELARFGASLLTGNAEVLLDRAQAEHPCPWVVPASPGHLAADWLVVGRGAEEADFPGDYFPELPFCMPMGTGRWYLSLADALCPSNCPEPPDICTATGKPRGKPLHQRLADIKAPGWQIAVLRSHQLAPGLGGVLWADLLDLRERFAARPGKWLVCTSCLCHGAAQALVSHGERP